MVCVGTIVGQIVYDCILSLKWVKKLDKLLAFVSETCSETNYQLFEFLVNDTRNWFDVKETVTIPQNEVIG